MKISQKTLAAISKTQRQARREGMKAEHLFSTNTRGFITYTGHTWEHNCAYSIEDMRRNDDFAICGNGPYGAVPAGLTDDNINQLVAEIESSFNTYWA